jgi:membrane protease YdiL (CAAX protease family)
MRYFFLLLALLLAAGPAVAQHPVAAAWPDSLVAAQAAPDTAAAIHRLFAAKRHRQVVIGVATAGAAIGALAAVSLSNQQPSRSGGSGYGSLVSGPIFDEQAIAMVAVGVITVPVALGELLLFGGWSKKKEQRVVADWERHKLARFFKRRLKPKYFVVPPSGASRKTT